MTELSPEALDTIEAEEFENVAKALFEIRDDPYDDDEWEDLDSTAREVYECQARAAMSVTAPELRHLRTENEEQRIVIGMFTNALESRDDGSYGWDDDALDAAASRAALTGEATT